MYPYCLFGRAAALIALLFLSFGSYGQGCITPILAGSSANAHNQYSHRANALAVDHDQNAITYVHRDVGAFFGGGYGKIRYFYSNNGGFSWQQGVNPLNPAETQPAIYPSVAPFNPTQSPNPANMGLAYYSGTSAGSSPTQWNGYVSGVYDLATNFSTENYNEAADSLTYISSNFARVGPGDFRTIDAVYDYSDPQFPSFDGLRVIRSNLINGVPVYYTDTTIYPAFNPNFSAGVLYDYSFAYDPSGQYGWICALMDLSNAVPGLLEVVFYRTTDGGANWTGPEIVLVDDFPCLKDKFDPTILGPGPEIDMVVDNQGRPHVLMEAGIDAGWAAYHEILIEPYTYMFDMTWDGGVYTAVPLGRRECYRGFFGGNTNYWLRAHPQASRNESGDKVFFFWTDSDSLVTGGANDQPDLMGCAYDVQGQMLSDVKNFTSCDPNFSGKAWYPKVAPEVLETAGIQWMAPAAVTRIGPQNDPTLAVENIVFQGVVFDTSDFVTPVCKTPAAISSSGDLCLGPVTLTAPQSAAYFWSTGDTGQSIQVSQPGSYWVEVYSNCCVGGTDSIVVPIGQSPFTAFTSTATGNGNVNFTDQTTSNPTTWAWDFGDGNTSSAQSPSHVYASSGTYQVCLVTSNLCGSDTACQNVTVTVVGLADALVESFQVAPHPVADRFSVMARFSMVGDLRLELMDLTGRKLSVLHEGWTDGVFERSFDAALLPAGMYCLRYELEGRSGVVRVVKR